MKKQDQLEPTLSLAEKLNLPFLTISEPKEVEKGEYTTFYFSLNDVKYKMELANAGDGIAPGESEIIYVDHMEETCHCCRKRAMRGKHCDFLCENSVALYEILLPQLENRLRWVSRRVYY